MSRASRPASPTVPGRRISRAGRLVVALTRGLLVALSGCGDDEVCPEIELCDVLEPACQKQVMEAVRCLRGGSSPLPTVTVLSEEELLLRLAGDGPPDQEAQHRYAQWQQGLARFDLAPSDYSVEQAQQDVVANVAAVYFRDTKQIALVERGEQRSLRQGIELFAHELIHALQDANDGLTRLDDAWVTSYDSDLAIAALTEGEAVHYQLLVGLQLLHEDPKKVDWRAYYEGWQSRELREAEHDEAPVALARVRFPYAFGGSMVAQHWLAGGRDGIRALYARPPITTREVLFGIDDPETREASLRERREFEARSVPALPPSFEEVASTSLGAWITRIFATRQGVDVGKRLRAAEVHLADVFSVQAEEETGELVAAWRARTRPAHSAQHWPGLDAPHLSSWLDLARREVYLASHGEGPAEAQSWAWRAPDSGVQEEGEATATPRRRHPAWRLFEQAHRCSLRRPPLESVRHE